MNKKNSSLIEIGPYLISYEEDTSCLSPHLNSVEIKQFQDLLIKAKEKPKESYKAALEWQKKHPNIAALDNLITYLHLRNGKIDLAEKAILQSYLSYPNYLFAKINYADQCIRKNKLSEISQIFPSFDLHTLFPKKSFFHAVEFRGFMMVAASYYFKKKDLAQTKKYLELAAMADPYHPSVLFLQKKLSKKKFFSVFLDKIVRLVRIS